MKLENMSTLVEVVKVTAYPYHVWKEQVCVSQLQSQKEREQMEKCASFRCAKESRAAMHDKMEKGYTLVGFYELGVTKELAITCSDTFFFFREV